LRTADGTSLWAEIFDLASTDVFTIEDKLAEQVATRLRLHLDPAQQSAFKARYPTFPNAYEFYIKGLFSLDERGYGLNAMPQMDATIGFLKNAIDADPNYRPARGQLAFAYVWTALFIAPADPKWADLARSEISRLKSSEQNSPRLTWQKRPSCGAGMRVTRDFRHRDCTLDHLARLEGILPKSVDAIRTQRSPLS
jgi:hypothetical protein